MANGATNVGTLLEVEEQSAKANLVFPLNSRDVARFFSSFDTQPSGCWIWKKIIRRPQGYGHFFIRRDGKLVNLSAHRLMLMMVTGRRPDPSVFACHTCDIRLCVNPRHLFWGTCADNMLDAAMKGRLGGERNAAAKLNEAQVIEIYRRRSAGEPRKVLAAEFGVSGSLISLIAHRKIWRNLLSEVNTNE